jgi:hypothetical protein
MKQGPVGKGRATIGNQLRAVKALIATGGLALLACTHQASPVLEPSAMPSPGSAIDRSVLLYLPEEFSQYRMRKKKGLHTYEYTLGPAVSQGLLDLLQGTFQRVENRPVAGLSPEQLMQADSTFDYVAVPAFAGADYHLGFTVGPSAEVAIEFLAQDGRRVTVRGKGRRGSAFVPDHDTLAAKVVRDVLTGIRDDLERQRESF